MTVHIGAKIGEIAPTVLAPGDPYRAKWAAENFLTNARLVNEVRGMLGFTGTYKGHDVTLQATGMGRPSTSIYVNELIRDYDVQTIIRVGSAGAIADHVGIRDVIIAMAASTSGNINKSWLGDIAFAASPDYGLLRKAADAVQSRGVNTHVGSIYTGDLFYEADLSKYDTLKSHGVLAVEMETAEIYTLAARYGRRALSILTVSDHIYTGEALPSEDRENTFGDMIEVALDAAF